MAQSRTLTICCMLGLLFTLASQCMSADKSLQVLSFSMDRCEPCQAMQPVLAKLIMEGWQIRQIDIAKEPKLTAQYQLKSAPTLILLADGRELDRIVGVIAYNKLLARLEAASRSSQSKTIGGTNPPKLLAQQTPGSQPATSQFGFEPSMVRGQSPGPADVPDLDVDNERMLEFVKDLPEPPKMVTPRSPAQPPNIQLASSSANIGRAAVQPSAQPNFNQPASAQPATVQPALAQTQSAPLQFDPLARAQQATVRIRIEDANSIAFGTGTVIYVQDNQALVLTCGHMFRDLGRGAQMSIDVFDKSGRATNVPAQVVSHSTEQGDIGLMEFRCPYPITPVPISKRAPALGDVAFSFGCDRGADPTRRDTQIKRINRYLGPANVEIHGAPVVGRSGGGLFNEQGQLVGVCNAADAEDDEGIYAALPVIDQHVAALRLESMPDDNIANSTASQSSNPVQLASATIGTPAIQTSQNPSATQVRCVIRDRSGKETALLIERPSEELVAMLKQSANK